MLMARPPPNVDSRRSSLPGNVQLPSFSHFVSGLGHHSPPHPPTTRTSTSRSDPSETPRLAALPHFDNQLQHRTHYPSSSLHGTADRPDYIDARPRSSLHLPRLAEPYREHHDPRTLAPNPGHPDPREISSTRSQRCLEDSPNHVSSNNKRVISETHVDGKGLCYVYEDGTVCQKVINGDMVNPKWGTTKAGKPRKRLGQACNTCREKKIRCDPQLPKCAQCQKFGRECKFETNSRTVRQASDRESPSARDPQIDLPHERTGSSTSAEGFTDHSYSRNNSRSSMNVESLLSPSSTIEASPVSEQPPSKKARLSSSPKQETDSPPKAAASGQVDGEGPERHTSTELDFAFDTDPYQVDPQLTMHYVKEYFKHVNMYIYVLFPSRLFQHWVEHDNSKSLSDKMLLYAILAAGAGFSQSRNSQTHLNQFKTIAEAALYGHTNQGLEAVQSQLILSLLEYSLGHLPRSRELATSAVRAAFAVGLSEEVDTADPILGMDLPVHLECRRRTFWLAFIAVSFHGNQFAPKHPVERLICNLRLPCEDGQFEMNDIPTMPRFEYRSKESWAHVEAPRQGSMAFLFEISLIANEVTAWLNSTSLSIPAPGYSDAYEQMHHETMRKLSNWNRRVREHYRTPEHSFTGLHFLYHFVGMLLNRHVRHESLRPEQVERCCRQTRSHAMQFLEMIHLIREDEAREIALSWVAAGCPMAGDTIVMAIDVVTAAGKISSLLEHESRYVSFIELVTGGAEALDTLTKHWKTAEAQLKEVKPHIASVMQCTHSGKAAWFVRQPLFSPYGMGFDVVYGIPRIKYLQALGYGQAVASEDDICELGPQSPN